MSIRPRWSVKEFSKMKVLRPFGGGLKIRGLDFPLTVSFIINTKN